jgi:hypothetical protein
MLPVASFSTKRSLPSSVTTLQQVAPCPLTTAPLTGVSVPLLASV